MSTTTTPVTVVATPKVTFFATLKAKIAGAFKTFFKDEPQWEAIAISTLTVITPLAGTILDLLDPAAAPLFNAVVSAIQTDLTALTLVVKDAGPAPTITSFVDSIKANLQQIEQVAGVKSPTSVAKVTAVTTTIADELDAIVGAMQAAQPTRA